MLQIEQAVHFKFSFIFQRESKGEVFKFKWIFANKLTSIIIQFWFI